MRTRTGVAYRHAAARIRHLETLPDRRLDLAVFLPELFVAVNFVPLPAHLPEDLRQLEEPRGADRMHGTDEPAGEIRRKPTAQIGVAALNELCTPTVRTEADVFVCLDVGNGESVMRLGKVEFFNRILDPRHEVRLARREPCREKTRESGPVKIATLVGLLCFIGKKKYRHVAPIGGA